MCGLWASVGFRPSRDAINLIHHRGPDGEGWKEFGDQSRPIVLGHKRLAIVGRDASGLQPMSYGNQRYWITYNGEVYNYLELRRELQANGYVFETASDTEVILAAYMHWGEECTEHFLGMFAFVILDKEKDCLFAARDRFGIKPLYLFERAGCVAFASEIKQFQSLPEFQARANLAVAYDFLMGSLANHRAETYFQGVLQVRGGEAVRVELANHATPRVKVYTWYSLPVAGSIEMTEREAVDRFRELFYDSINLHLRADVPVGSCLSGGLDSSSIVCAMQKILTEQTASNKVYTVSSCFDEKAVDERQFIEAVVAASGAKSEYVFPSAAGLVENIEKITWHQDEPFGSTSIFAQWCVFGKARDLGLTVMLDGQGADEQLAGYHGMFPIYLSELLADGKGLDALKLIYQRSRVHGVPFWSEVAKAFGVRLPARIQSMILGQRKAVVADSLLNLDAWRECELNLPPYLAAIKRDDLGELDSVGSLCRILTKTTNLPSLLHFEDRNSMSHSIEARVPFLDHRLVELNIGLGSAHKAAGIETKRILREAMKDVLPRKVTNRMDKLGFPTPEEIWFKGELRPQVEKWLDESLEWFPELFDKDGVTRMAQNMLDGRRPFDFTLWRIISLGMWGQTFGVKL